MPRSGDGQPLSIEQITSFSSQVAAKLDERFPRYQQIAPGVLPPDKFTTEIAQERVDYGALVGALVYFKDLTLELSLKGKPVTKTEVASLKSKTRGDIATKYGMSEKTIPKKIKPDVVEQTLEREGIVFDGKRPKAESKVQASKVTAQPESQPAEEIMHKETPTVPKWFIEIIQIEPKGKEKKRSPFNMVKVNGKRIKLEHDEEKVLLLFADAREKSLASHKEDDRRVSIIDIHRSLTGEPQEKGKTTQEDYAKYAKLVTRVVAGLRDKINPKRNKPWPITAHKEHTHLREELPDVSSSYALSDKVVITRVKSAEAQKRKAWDEKIRKSDRQFALAYVLDGWTAGLQLDPKYIITVLPRVKGNQQRELTPIQAANSLTMHIISMCDPRKNDTLDSFDKTALEGLIKLMRPDETLFEVVGRVYTLFGQDPQKFRLPRTGKNARYMDHLEGLVRRTRGWFEENHPLLKTVEQSVSEQADAVTVENVIHKMTLLRINRVWRETLNRFPLPDGGQKNIGKDAGRRYKIHQAMRGIKQKGNMAPIDYAKKLIIDKIFVPTSFYDKDPALSRTEIAAINCVYGMTDGGKKDIELTPKEFTALIYVMRQKLNEIVAQT